MYMNLYEENGRVAARRFRFFSLRQQGWVAVNLTPEPRLLYVKVGKEIRSLNTLTSNVITTSLVSKKTGRVSLPKAGLAFVLGLAALLSPLQLSLSLAHAGGTASVWWPAEGARVSGIQPFKAVLDGANVESYEMFWQVDGGALNRMESNYADYPHKEVSVDVGSWNWRGSGPYTLNFVARQNGTTVAERSVSIYVEGAAAPAPVSLESSASRSYAGLDSVQIAQMWELVKAVESGKDTDPVHIAQANAFKASHTTSAPASAPEPAATSVELKAYSAPAPVVSGNPLSGLNFYVNKNSPAAAQAERWRQSRPGDAAKMDVLAQTPTAQWLGGWSGDVQSAVGSLVSTARSQGQTPIMVAYNIPQRDCGGFSAGGTSDYQNWIGGVARGIGNNSAIVILEPDALAGITCLSHDDQRRRLELLSSAVSILKSNPHTEVYIDAGHSGWIDPATMAARLQAANIAKADGFATNVSNFMTTGDEVGYGTKLSERLGGAHFVVDTARNGNGSNGEWCNPWGRAIGAKPTTHTGSSLVDAYLWLKTPGESDGNCNGGPSAGTWWPDYALHLVR